MPLYKKSQSGFFQFMYQTAGQDLIENYKHVLDVPFHIFETKNVAINQNTNYSRTENGKVEIMYQALDELKKKK